MDPALPTLSSAQDASKRGARETDDKHYARISDASDVETHFLHVRIYRDDISETITAPRPPRFLVISFRRIRRSPRSRIC
jgi:hypothetical protein